MTYNILILYSLYFYDEPTLLILPLNLPDSFTRKIKLMKKLLFILFAGSLLVFMLSSCAATKRDCQGVKHYKLKNGIYI